MLSFRTTPNRPIGVDWCERYGSCAGLELLRFRGRFLFGESSSFQEVLLEVDGWSLSDREMTTMGVAPAFDVPEERRLRFGMRLFRVDGGDAVVSRDARHRLVLSDSGHRESLGGDGRRVPA